MKASDACYLPRTSGPLVCSKQTNIADKPLSSVHSRLGAMMTVFEAGRENWVTHDQCLPVLSLQTSAHVASGRALPTSRKTSQKKFLSSHHDCTESFN
eukprot:1887132-Amphidinium_carterae.1